MDDNDVHLEELAKWFGIPNGGKSRYDWIAASQEFVMLRELQESRRKLYEASRDLQELEVRHFTWHQPIPRVRGV